MSILQAALLSAFTNLEHLVLHFAAVVPYQTGTQDLLTLLPQLQQLTALELRMAHCLKARYLRTSLTALTASTRLQCLNLDCTLFPSKAWQHVFAPSNTVGNRLPQLEGLSLWNIEPSLSVSDIECIVRCCPNLKAFSFQGAGKMAAILPADAVPLLKGLTKMHTTHVNDDFVQAVVQQLSGLRDLELARCIKLQRSPAAVLQAQA